MEYMPHFSQPVKLSNWVTHCAYIFNASRKTSWKKIGGPLPIHDVILPTLFLGASFNIYNKTQTQKLLWQKKLK